MSHNQALSQWMGTVSTAFANLSRPQAKVLAYWSYGMVIAKACGIVLVSAAFALELGEKEGTLVQRLREWCYAATDKKGKKRRELEVSTCFAPLLRWVLSWWPAEETRLALASHQDDRPGAGRTLVVSHCRRHGVGAQRGRPG
jgi:hypothetical protein